MKKMAILFIMSLIVVSISAQKKEKIKGNKQVSELAKEIPFEFNTLEVNDNLEINLRPSSSNNYSLTADSNLHNVVQFIVTDSVLKVFTTDHIVSSKKLQIDLTLKELNYVIVKHDAKIKGEGQFRSDNFFLNGYGNSRVDLDIKADEVTVTLYQNAGGKIQVKSENTAITMNDRTDLKAYVAAEKVKVELNNTSDLDLSGDANYAVFNLKKSANLNARKMKVSSADLYTSNSSDVYVNASKNLGVYAQGKSHVYVYGNPELEIKGLNDKSKIIKK